MPRGKRRGNILDLDRGRRSPGQSSSGPVAVALATNSAVRTGSGSEGVGSIGSGTTGSRLSAGSDSKVAVLKAEGAIPYSSACGLVSATTSGAVGTGSDTSVRRMGLDRVGLGRRDRHYGRIRHRMRGRRGFLGRRRGVGFGRIGDRSGLLGDRRRRRRGPGRIRCRIVARRDGGDLDLDRGLGLGRGRGLSLVHGVGSDILSGTDADPGDGSGAGGRLGGRPGRLAGPGSAPSGLGDGRRGRIEAEIGRFGVIGFTRRQARDPYRRRGGAQAGPSRPPGRFRSPGRASRCPSRLIPPSSPTRATTPADPEARRGSRPRAAGRPAPAKARRRPPRRRSRPAVRPAPIPPGWPGSFARRRGPRGPVPAVERCRRETVGPRARAVRWMCAASRSREAVLPACRTRSRRSRSIPPSFPRRSNRHVQYGSGGRNHHRWWGGRSRRATCRHPLSLISARSTRRVRAQVGSVPGRAGAGRRIVGIVVSGQWSVVS